MILCFRWGHVRQLDRCLAGSWRWHAARIVGFGAAVTIGDEDGPLNIEPLHLLRDLCPVTAIPASGAITGRCWRPAEVGLLTLEVRSAVAHLVARTPTSGADADFLEVKLWMQGALRRMRHRPAGTVPHSGFSP